MLQASENLQAGKIVAYGGPTVYARVVSREEFDMKSQTPLSQFMGKGVYVTQEKMVCLITPGGSYVAMPPSHIDRIVDPKTELEAVSRLYGEIEKSALADVHARLARLRNIRDDNIKSIEL